LEKAASLDRQPMVPARTVSPTPSESALGGEAICETKTKWFLINTEIYNGRHGAWENHAAEFFGGLYNDEHVFITSYPTQILHLALSDDIRRRIVWPIIRATSNFMNCRYSLMPMRNNVLKSIVKFFCFTSEIISIVD
jgi:hypothetical protein